MNNALDRAMNASAAISVRQARFFFAGFYSYAYFYFFCNDGNNSLVRQEDR